MLSMKKNGADFHFARENGSTWKSWLVDIDIGRSAISNLTLEVMFKNLAGSMPPFQVLETAIFQVDIAEWNPACYLVSIFSLRQQICGILMPWNVE